MTRAGGTSRTGFNEQLQHLWQTRPVRLPRRGPIAGVAAGFGQRYAVDPVLIRVAFVVSTIFGGAGVVLYLLAWLLLPAYGDEVSPTEGLLGRGRTSQRPVRTVVLLVVLGIAVSTAGPIGFGTDGAGLISFMLMLAGWWLMFRREPNPPAGVPTATTDYPAPAMPETVGWYPTGYGPYTTLPDHYEPDPAAAQTVPASAVPQDAPESESAAAQSNPTAPESAAVQSDPSDQAKSAAAAADSTGQAGPGTATPQDTPDGPRTVPPRTAVPDPTRFGAMPPGWDPLGVSPLAWELPEPRPAQPTAVTPPVKQPRSKLTPIVIFLAILAAAGATAAAFSGQDWLLTPGRIGAVALAVLGLGMVVGAFLRRGYGLMTLAIPLAGFVVLASQIGPVDLNDGAVASERTWSPATTSDLAQPFRVTMGSGELDLRQLALNSDATVDAKVRMGELRIVVPPSMRVDTRCDTRLTDPADCVPGLSGPPTGPLLTLNIDVRAGHVEVDRRG
ncbi:PspC domain-containing protein [Nocardia stercoris]|uniref:PspC domain-containing protein n=1 Tax=Nocardia stercoris TaxID=2483361 RepID=A0A3M2LB00_9NOCA|nr:PspC domain-containing protein [Nocardia stercoris]RMI31798.1 PspC domain-containing protein [Nocardia stercoris]